MTGVAPRARVVAHPHALARRQAALALANDARDPLVVVGARIETARAFVAECAIATGARAFVDATTLDRLAAQIARPELERSGRTIAGTLAVSSAAAEAIAELAPSLPRMGPLRATPGLPRAIARTLEELWAADLGAASVAPHDAELGQVMARVERTLAAERLVPRARVLEHALLAMQSLATPIDGARVIFLDVAITTRLAGELARAIAARAKETLFTVPLADTRTLGRLADLPTDEGAPNASDGATLARTLFADERAPIAASALEAVLARGEAAEAAELARRALAAARAGTPLHRIAIVVRRPELARGSIEAAFGAAPIPLVQRRGARRPDPSGRAFLALLECAIEGLSARAFAAYLSHGVLPESATGDPPDAVADAFVSPLDEGDDEDDAPIEPERARAIRVGTLRAPRRWERMLVEAAVIGGEPERWRRRLDGLRAELEAKHRELERTGQGAPHLARSIEELALLARFALPLLEDLAALPARASVASYRHALSSLATRALRSPSRVLEVLDGLEPRAASGVGADATLTLGDLAHALAPSLGAIETRPATLGVQVVTPDELRGLSFDVVLVPALAERVFPMRVPEDPLLPDATRRAISPDLEDAHARAANERLLLALAVGAAEQRVVALASITTADGRARVPSVYFVELLGRKLGRRASRADVAAAGREAVRRIGRADDAAHDGERALARIRALAALPIADASGRANDLAERNPFLRSALARSWRRAQPSLGASDGLHPAGPSQRLAALEAHDPARRPYSATALESFATCPYRFFLKAILRLEPAAEPEALETLDPMTRGLVAHEAQFRTLLALRTAERLPITASSLPDAIGTLDDVFAAMRIELVERLVPAIPRVFHVELDLVLADLRAWLTRLADDDAWRPRWFELAFGLPEDGDRDPESRAAPVHLAEGFTLRGSIDLVEERASDGALRATDHKTGSTYAIDAHLRTGPLVVRGGQSLQPVLYALALEALFPGRTVEGGRLWFATQRAHFASHAVRLDAEARSAIQDLRTSISGAIAGGKLPAVPVRGACTFCDYAIVCGPHAETRAAKIPAKNVDHAVPGLVALRSRR